MQDFNYLSSNAFEVTLELGCEKYPHKNLLYQEWVDNKDPLIELIWQVSYLKRLLSLFIYRNNTIVQDSESLTQSMVAFCQLNQPIRR